MLNFTRDQRASAFDKLPREVKSAFTSTVLSDLYQKIGKENGLNIEKTGLFAHVIAITILGLIPRDKLITTLSSELGIDNNQATKLAQIANEKIFLKFRDIAKQQQTFEESEQYNEMMSRTEKEEEKPLIVEKPIAQTSIQQNQQKTPVPPQPNVRKTLLDMENTSKPPVVEAPSVIIPKVVAPEVTIPKGNPRPWEVAKQQIAQNFVGNKLTQNTVVSTERKQMGIQTQNNIETDPYREKA